MDLADFKASHKSKRTVIRQIAEHKSTVFELRDEEYSYQTISLWLKENEVNVSEHAVRRFFDKYQQEFADYMKSKRVKE